MPSTQKKVVSNMEVVEHPTTITIEGPGPAIQVTGTKITIPATWSPSDRPRQPTKTGNNNNNNTTTKTGGGQSDDAHHHHHQDDDAPSSSSSSSSSTTSRINKSNTGTCDHQWQPSPSQAASLESMPASYRRALSRAARHVPDCAKPNKGLIPTPAPKWCPKCCCAGQAPPPWAEAPKPKPKRKEEEKREDDEDEYDWRQEDDAAWTDVWYDDD